MAYSPLKLKILRQLLAPAVYAQQKLWPRELKWLKALLQQYPDPDFWLSLKPFIPLDSLLYFKGKTGQAFLEEEWQMYQFHKGQRAAAEEAQLQRSIDALEEQLSTPNSNQNSLDKTTKPATVRQRQDPLSWADSL